MGKSEELKVVFEYEKATKNTCKYTEKPAPGQPPRIASLYIQKWVFGTDTPPQRLAVTVELAPDASCQGEEKGK